MFKIGDIVGRKSYQCDIIFEVVDIKEKDAILFGKTMRLVADAPLEDLVLIEPEEILREENREDAVMEDITNQTIKLNRKKYLTGKILHIDGDGKYMRKCLDLYQKIGIHATGVEVKEKDVPRVILKYIKYLNPDIIVITGHDSFNKREPENLNNYRNSKYFNEAIQVIRQNFPVLNQPIIIAGACQSHFEALIASGANFASSPNRVNIQSLDPAIIAIKCSATGISEVIKVSEAIDKTSSKNEGIGGIVSFGTMRTLYF